MASLASRSFFPFSHCITSSRSYYKMNGSEGGICSYETHCPQVWSRASQPVDQKGIDHQKKSQSQNCGWTRVVKAELERTSSRIIPAQASSRNLLRNKLKGNPFLILSILVTRIETASLSLSCLCWGIQSILGIQPLQIKMNCSSLAAWLCVFSYIQLIWSSDLSGLISFVLGIMFLKFWSC